jgi:hypothetical protein
MLTPEFSSLVEEQTEETKAPTKTWLIQDGRLMKSIEGEEATKQMIWKSLLTERFVYPIYSNNYGSEIATLIGSSHSQNYLETAVPNMVVDALSIDDRINGVVSVEVMKNGEELRINATINSTDGEVKIDV